MEEHSGCSTSGSSLRKLTKVGLKTAAVHATPPSMAALRWGGTRGLAKRWHCMDRNWPNNTETPEKGGGEHGTPRPSFILAQSLRCCPGQPGDIAGGRRGLPGAEIREARQRNVEPASSPESDGTPRALGLGQAES